MKKKIIFICDIGCQKRDFDRFGIKILSKKFDVLFLDCTKWLQPKFYKKKAESNFLFKERIEIKNFKHLCNEINQINTKNIIGAIDLIGISSIHTKIRNFLKSKLIKIIYILNTEIKTKNSQLQKLIFYINKKNKISAIYRKLFKKPKQNYNTNDADILILCGDIGKKFLNDHQKSINLCHFDYDIYLDLKKKKIKNKLKSYALFLDQYLPMHSGQNYIGNQSRKMNVKEYYKNLENFFSKFEEKYKIEVVVAAHPRANYEKNKLLNSKRKYYLNKTPELVKNSSIVFTHTSTAMNFAILFDKPIFFLTLDNYRKTHDYFRPNFLSQHFKTFCFEIDRKFDFPKKNKLFNTNKSVYKKYKKDYLVTSNYDDSKLWNSFSNKISLLR